MLPISENRIGNRGRSKKKSDYQKKIKLPSDMQSKHQRKCPICRCPMSDRCLKCGYIHSPIGDASGGDFIKAGHYKGKYLVEVDV